MTFSEKAMENLKTCGMEVSSPHNINIKIYENSPCVDPVVQALVEEAKDRLKTFEQDYEHTSKKYREVKANIYKCYLEEKGSIYHSQKLEYCLYDCKDLLEQLQNVIGIEEAPQRRIETPNHSKKNSMLHGCTSLTQEKMILQQIGEHEYPKNDNLSKKLTYFETISSKFNRTHREISRISNKKHTHNMLDKLKEAYKLREKAILIGAMVDNPTSQDNIENSTINLIKLLAKVIKELEKEKEETNKILLEQRRVEEGYKKKMKHLLNKREWLCGKWDDERNYMLGLKNIHDELEYFLPVYKNWID